MPIMIRTRRTLTRNGREKASQILDTLKNVRSSKREHVFKHISFVNKLFRDLLEEMICSSFFMRHWVNKICSY